jgi:FkbM family methyltransferase
LRDDYSKQLLVDLLKFRVLREKRVKLPLNNSEYWSKRKSVDKNFLKKRGTLTDPWNWPLNHYQLQGICGTLNLHLDPLTVLEIFIQQQYAYRQSGRVIEVQPGDVVIDGGGLWGETALYFADKTEAKGKVYCFEFVPDNLEILQRNIEFNQHLADSIVVIPKALWDISGETLEYSPNGPATSVMYTPEQWPWQVQTIAIDDLVEEEQLPRVDYIKMDIEGAELKALRGAERTIRTFRPKLAVSLYHDWDDFILIPGYLNNLSLGYEFFLDHFTIHAEETVLFAHPKG